MQNAILPEPPSSLPQSPLHTHIVLEKCQCLGVSETPKWPAPCSMVWPPLRNAARSPLVFLSQPVPGQEHGVKG